VSLQRTQTTSVTGVLSVIPPRKLSAIAGFVRFNSIPVQISIHAGANSARSDFNGAALSERAL
jgi:hypothetical protein